MQIPYYPCGGSGGYLPSELLEALKWFLRLGCAYFVIEIIDCLVWWKKN